MPDGSGTWADLAPRTISGVLLAALGLAAIWLGGVWFAALVALATGLIGWEITRICAPERPGLWALIGLLAGLGLIAAIAVPGFLGLPILLGTTLLAVAGLGPASDRLRAGLYLGWVLFAGWGLVALRADGIWPVVWLVSVVVATDLAGYFAGRLIGGPKFWPKVSPKKTWSGTAAGWIAAAVVGVLFIPVLGAGAIWLSVLVSFASQMGDAAESALKRAKGVKDASQLIPGHGGVFDRFDALMGAALVVTLARGFGLGG